MKKIVLILFVIIPVIGFSQFKPNLSKTEKLLREGKIDEAKTQIDATITNQEFMVDKKGQPSKNAANAWFLKGAVYAAIDTTSKEQFKSLEAHPFPIAKAAFEKATELDPKAPAFLKDASGFLPMMNDQVFQSFASKYFNIAITSFQEKKDYKRAWEYTEYTYYFAPKDTSVLSYGGIYFGPAAEEWDKSLEFIKKYHAAGGKSQDSYVQVVTIYRDKLKDNDKALTAIKEAMVALPNNTLFPQLELDMYIKTNKLPEAKEAMERQIKADPTNKISWYYLGVINYELKDYPAARKAYEEALRLDNQYFEATYAIAEVAFMDAKKVKAEMNQLGITPADRKKKLDLDKVYVDELKKVVPYWEAAEKLSPDDSKVLDTLLGIYSDLGDQPKITKLSVKMKKLGLLD
ncbi:hypothetical protein BH09BAC3_BH09BAC3_29690 [soil metagenome]